MTFRKDSGCWEPGTTQIGTPYAEVPYCSQMGSLNEHVAATGLSPVWLHLVASNSQALRPMPRVSKPLLASSSTQGDRIASDGQRGRRCQLSPLSSFKRRPGTGSPEGRSVARRSSDLPAGDERVWPKLGGDGRRAAATVRSEAGQGSAQGADPVGPLVNSVAGGEAGASWGYGGVARLPRWNLDSGS